MSTLEDQDQRTIFQPLADDSSFRNEPTAYSRRGGLAPGTLLNNIYEVRSFLARGGMGEVYAGVNVNTDERVAIKVMLPQLAADPKVQAMFRKEARILTELAHPALVRYRVLAQEPHLDLFYIVTEFIDGQSISDLLGKLRPSSDELKALTRRLADGLAAAHAHGAVHRDMSPDNVLLPQGRLEHAKIIDFGIARESNLPHQTIIGDSFAGKLAYVAPEQFGDFGRQIGPWTDIYSLGLVVLALAAGQAVDMGVTLVEAVDRRREGVDLSPLPEALRPVFQRMLAPDPAHRFQTMAEVIEALDAIGLPAPATAATAPVAEAIPHEEPPAEDAPTPRRAPRALVVSLLLLGGAVAAFGVTLATRPRTPQPATATVPIQLPVEPPHAVALAEADIPTEVAPTAAAPLAAAEALPAAPPTPKPVAKARAPIAVVAAPRPIQLAASAPELPVASAPAPKAAAEPAAPVTATAASNGADQACWRAVGNGWTYIGYASRQGCSARVFDKECQVIYGRWGDQQLRRYNGKLQLKGTGVLARWKDIGAAQCSAEPGAAR